MKSFIWMKLGLVLLVLGLAVWAAWYFRGGSVKVEPEVYISLAELPGVSADALAAQGKLFRVAEPFLYNRETGMAVFVVEILSTKNFGDEGNGERFLRFGGDAESLQGFANEVRMVNAGPARLKAAAQGVSEGAESLVGGLWQVLRHPIDTATKLGDAAVDLAIYVKDTPLVEMEQDVADLAGAYYDDKARQVGESHGVNYFELKTARGRAVVESEANHRLGGEAALEMATLLVPFSKLKHAGKAADLGEVAKRASGGRLSHAQGLFPQVAARVTVAANRARVAMRPQGFKPPRATLGQSTTTDYKKTFFAAHPELAKRVEVHHAVPREAWEDYPNLISKAELHSLENLRGIPAHISPKLHQSQIHSEWNAFMKVNPPGVMTRKMLLDKASEIDFKYGYQFFPAML
ncbi:MAG TPA: hypothetical protein VGH19_00425 [Verrucomicrobiae bacterium]